MDKVRAFPQYEGDVDLNEMFQSPWIRFARDRMVTLNGKKPPVSIPVDKVRAYKTELLD